MSVKIQQQQSDFAEADWDGWRYSPSSGQHLALAKGVAYVNDKASLPDLDKRNEQEGRHSARSETALSLTHQGLYVGIVYGPPEGAESKWRRLKFEPPVPLDEAISGDQPPITGKYPRVVFPSEGTFRYGILVSVDSKEAAALRLGTQREEHTVLVHPGDTRASIDVPAEAPCDKEVRDAIAKFDPQGINISPGRYVIRMEVERLPVVSIRVDGGKPFTSFLVREGGLKPELPIMDFGKLGLSMGVSRERANPLERHVGSAKYVEIPTVIPVGGEDTQWACFDKVILKTDRATQEEAELRYVSLRRGDSVAEVRNNPNFGLIEVQIDRVAKITSLEIDFRPESLPPRSSSAIRDSFFGDTDRGQDSFSYGGGMKGLGGSDFHSTRGFSTPSVNAGRTELAKPRVAPAAPTMHAEWDGHLRTFRFCLTNQIS